MSPSNPGEFGDVTASWGAEGGAWAVLVHGGAGDLRAERVDAHVDGCPAAAQAAAELLRAGASALDAVERAVSCSRTIPPSTPAPARA